LPVSRRGASNTYSLSLHVALPIYKSLREKIPFRYGGYSIKARGLYYKPSKLQRLKIDRFQSDGQNAQFRHIQLLPNYSHKNYVKDRKSTRLNSSHVSISYAVFCLR